VPTALTVGLGEACRVAMQEMSYDAQHVAGLSRRLKSKIAEELDFVVVNGDTDHTYPGEEGAR
jgi:cysteine desulfurase